MLAGTEAGLPLPDVGGVLPTGHATGVREVARFLSLLHVGRSRLLFPHRQAQPGSEVAGNSEELDRDLV